MHAAAAPKRAQRIAVLGVITALHLLALHFLTSAANNYNSFDNLVTEAEMLPVDQRPPEPPAWPEIVFQASSPLNLQVPQVAIDTYAEEPPNEPLAEPVIQTVAAVTDTVEPPVEVIPVVGPRPLSGPRGIDRYPHESLRGRESGTVVITVCVSPQGRVASVELARSSGFPRLDAVALGIAADYQFQPAMRLGRPVAACERYSIVFKVG
jgi:periplasmic protein TonB